MPQNVEIKASIKAGGFVDLLNLVRSLCGTNGYELLVQEDTFFNTTNGRLKLREFRKPSQRRSELIFYDRADVQGVKLSDYAKVGVDDAKALKEVLSLAHGVSGIVRKTRHLFIYEDHTRVHLDQVDGLGDFLELEVCLSEGQTLSKGEQIAEKLLDLMHIPKSALIKGSYLDQMK